MNRKSSESRKAWWAKLTPQQRAEFVAKREAKRRQSKRFTTKPLGRVR